MPAPRQLDPLAVRSGALRALVLALPPAIIGNIVDRWPVLFALATMFGLLEGAAYAATHQRLGTPLLHGIVVAVGVFVVVQAAGLARRSLAGDDLHWSLVISSLVLSAFVGMLGGLMAGWLRSLKGRPPMHRDQQP